MINDTIYETNHLPGEINIAGRGQVSVIWTYA